MIYQRLHFLLKVMMAIVPLFIFSCDEQFEEPPEVTTSDNFVDLRPQQSALKNQGNRTTCITFAAVAALEAAYIRTGYGELDLSEEFINFSRKSFYLHPIWSDHLAAGIDSRETQLGSTGGGGGTGVIAELKKGFKIPLESVMGYQTASDYYENNYESLRTVLQKLEDGETVYQRDYSNFNLDSTILTSGILRTEKFYSIGVYRDIADPKSTGQIENVLKKGFEVVWDFSGAVPWDSGGMDGNGVWQKCASCGPMAHSMLIVGFDKRDPDPDKHYFIVKNSWGSSFTATGGEGYTYISYDYLSTYGVAANYVVLPNAPATWPELAFIGRWKLNYDGFKGNLDIYHLPGMAQYTFEYNYEVGRIPEVYNDYRIGTFYDTENNAYRVNGHINGNRIEFYFDQSTPMLRWDKLQGRRFVYYLDGSNFMAGYHTDGDGKSYGGYARKAGFLPGGTETGRPFSEQSYLQTQWNFYTEGYSGELAFNEILSEAGDDFYLLGGTYTPSGGTIGYAAQLKIMKIETNKTYLQIANMGDGTVKSFIGRHLSWEKGLITGSTPETGESMPFYMTKTE